MSPLARLSYCIYLTVMTWLSGQNEWGHAMGSSQSTRTVLNQIKVPNKYEKVESAV